MLGTIDDAGTRRVYRFRLDGGAPAAVTKASTFGALALSRNGKGLVAIRQSFTEPPTLVSIAPRTGAATKLSTFNDAALAGFDQGKVESVTYKGAKDADIQMWVIYPPGFDATKKYPALMLLHGGPHNAHHRRRAVALERGGVRELGLRRDLAQLPRLERLRQRLHRLHQPGLDHAAVRGHHQGGRLADGEAVHRRRAHGGGRRQLRRLPRHHLVRPQASVQGAGGACRGLQPVHAAGRRTTAPKTERFFNFWDKPEEFAKYSPHTSAGNFNTPTLVIHNQLDLRVPLNHGIELFNTLQKRGVPSKLVYFPDENHWVLKPQNSLFWYQTVRDWVATYAKPGPY